MIRTKRDGGRLSDAAIDWVIDAYTDGRVADEQMSALLMAIFLRGMDRGEIARWTAAMLASGERMDFSDLRCGRPDRGQALHRWGGRQDHAGAGARHRRLRRPRCRKAAGRGLGHTGGTLDKLESIAGFTAELSNAASAPTTVRRRRGDIRRRAAGAGRREALRAARYHRHRRIRCR